MIAQAKRKDRRNAEKAKWTMHNWGEWASDNPRPHTFWSMMDDLKAQSLKIQGVYIKLNHKQGAMIFDDLHQELDHNLHLVQLAEEAMKAGIPNADIAYKMQIGQTLNVAQDFVGILSKRASHMIVEGPMNDPIDYMKKYFNNTREAITVSHILQARLDGSLGQAAVQEILKDSVNCATVAERALASKSFAPGSVASTSYTQYLSDKPQMAFASLAQGGFAAQSLRKGTSNIADQLMPGTKALMGAMIFGFDLMKRALRGMGGFVQTSVEAPPQPAPSFVRRHKPAWAM